MKTNTKKAWDDLAETILDGSGINYGWCLCDGSFVTLEGQEARIFGNSREFCEDCYDSIKANLEDGYINLFVDQYEMLGLMDEYKDAKRREETAKLLDQIEVIRKYLPSDIANGEAMNELEGFILKQL